MDCVIGRRVIADAHRRVNVDTFGTREVIVVVDEAAFGGFEVLGSEGVGGAAEGEGEGGGEGLGVEGYYKIF